MKWSIAFYTAYLLIRVLQLGTFCEVDYNILNPIVANQNVNNELIPELSIFGTELIPSFKSIRSTQSKSWFEINFRDAIISFSMTRQGSMAKPYSGLGNKLRPGLRHGDNKKLSLSYLCTLLIINAHDNETNPGPYKVKFPCFLCSKAVKWGQKGIRCDNCMGWYHADCINMGSQTYEYLGNNSITWICPSCGLPNYSSESPFTSGGSIELSNSFESLTSEGDIPNSPLATSSLIKKNKPKSFTKNKNNNRRVLVVNCQRLRTKKEAFAACLENHSPAVVIGTESFLTSSVLTSEIFPHNFSVFRRDRPVTREIERGGGVFVAINGDIIGTQVTRIVN
jgi:hypothetical protein